MGARDGRNVNLRLLPDNPDNPDRGANLPRPLVAAWVALLWISAPLLPALRNYLNENAAGGFNRYVAVGLLAAAAVIVASTWLIASGRRWRAVGTLIVLCVGFALVYLLLAAPDPRSRVVEAAHFVQYGTLACLAFFSLRGLSLIARSAQTFLLVVAVGLVDELIQWVLAARVAEIRDVAVNAAAGAFGLLYAGFVLKEGGAKRGELVWPIRAELRDVAISGALVLPVLGAFMYFVHLGDWIRWNKVEFVSQYRAESLTALPRSVECVGLPSRRASAGDCSAPPRTCGESRISTSPRPGATFKPATRPRTRETHTPPRERIRS